MGAAIADADVVLGALKLEMSGKQVVGSPTKKNMVMSASSTAAAAADGTAGSGSASQHFDTLLSQFRIKVLQVRESTAATACHAQEYLGRVLWGQGLFLLTGRCVKQYAPTH